MLSAFSNFPPTHLGAESWSQALSPGSGADVIDSPGSGFSRGLTSSPVSALRALGRPLITLDLSLPSVLGAKDMKEKTG